MKYRILFLVLISTFYSCKEKTENKSESVNEKTGLKSYPSKTVEKIEPKKIDHSNIQSTKFAELISIPDSLELIPNRKLIADFNGDNRADFASMVINLNDEQQGVLIIHDSNPQEIYVFGAGKEVNEMTDLNWIEVFEIIPKGEIVSPTIVDEISGDILGQDQKQNFKLIGNGIYMTVEESHGGGILFWNGEKYKWFHNE